MSKPNAYLKKQEEIQQKFLDVGEEMGMQKMWDYFQIVLRNTEVMGKDTFGAKRLEKVFEAMKKAADEYHTAFTDDKEADYYQEKLDTQLKEIWGDKAVPFYERYPDLKRIKYDKGRKGWR